MDHNHAQDAAPTLDATNSTEILRQLRAGMHSRTDQLEASRQSISRVRALLPVSAHWPIAWPTWPPGIVPKLVAMSQKILRRLLRWYVDPIVAQQNRVNTELLEAVDNVIKEIDHLRSEIWREQIAERNHIEMRLKALIDDSGPPAFLRCEKATLHPEPPNSASDRPNPTGGPDNGST